MSVPVKNFTTNFTTSGIKGIEKQRKQRTHLPFSCSTYPYINDFEIQFLYSSMIFMSLSPAHQMLVKQEAQTVFFAWMEQKYSQMEKTTHHMKRMRYKEIVEKILASFSEVNYLFSFLSASQAPVFNPAWDSELPVVSVLASSSSAILFPPFVVTGVIPSLPYKITLCVPTSSEAKRVDKTVWNPFHPSVFESDFALPSVPTVSATFPPSTESDEAVHVADSSHMDCFMREGEISIEYSKYPNVADTLRQIADIHDEISKFCNTTNLDSLLGPRDLLNGKYPGSSLSLINDSEQ